MRKTRRLGARKARRKLRQQGPSPEQAPIRPGMLGGAYKPLGERDVEQIHEASLDILERIGISEPDADADDYSARVDARLGYGLSLNGRDGVLMPYTEMTLGATDSYRIGMN